ncbi:MAG: SRPBCC domain-containing protein [Azospirillaceae bacterium]
MGKTVETAVEIAAPPEAVWAVLADFGSYGDWNPLIRRVDGRPAVGERLDIQLSPGARNARFPAEVLEAEAPRALVWRGRMAGGLVTGTHWMRLSPAGDGGVGTRLEHGETFSGPLALLLGRRLTDGARLGFQAMNRAVKARAEGPG